MDDVSVKTEFFGKRYTFLGCHDVQLRVGTYILYVAKNLTIINKKLADVVARGIHEKEKCIVICDEASRDELKKALEKNQLIVEQLIRYGQFFFITDRESLAGKKDFSYDTFFSKLQGFIDDTCLQGWSALRLIVDVQWLLDAGAKSKDFLKLEGELLNRFGKTRSPLLFLSYLSATQVSPKNLVEMTNSHHMLLFDDNFMTSSITDTANIDNLTRLFNHNFFREILKKEIFRCVRYKRPCSVVIFDIDEFKHINRQYGYTRGDELLLNISNILIKNIRNVDIPGRFAGEQFSVLLPETDKAGASVMANRILRTVTETVRIEDFPVTLSAGIAQYPQDSNNDNEMVDNALKALRIGQKKGRNQVGMLETPVS